MDKKVKTITVKKVLTHQDGTEEKIERQIPEVYPGEFDNDDSIVAEILMDMFFSNSSRKKNK